MCVEGDYTHTTHNLFFVVDNNNNNKRAAAIKKFVFARSQPFNLSLSTTQQQQQNNNKKKKFLYEVIDNKHGNGSFNIPVQYTEHAKLFFTFRIF